MKSLYSKFLQTVPRAFLAIPLLIQIQIRIPAARSFRHLRVDPHRVLDEVVGELAAPVEVVEARPHVHVAADSR